MGENHMRTARLFALAVAGFVLLGILFNAKAKNDAAVDMYIHDRYVVLPHWSAIWIAVVICGVFAILYFASGRWLRNPLNSGLSLASFVLTVLPLAVLILTVLALHQPFPPERVSRLQNFILFHLAVPIAALTICFLLGCLLFAVNFCWALIRGLRTRG